MIYAPVELLQPMSRAKPNPFCWSNTTLMSWAGLYDSMRSKVPSVEPPSTTMISLTLYSLLIIESRHFTMLLDEFLVRTTALITGFIAIVNVSCYSLRTHISFYYRVGQIDVKRYT